MTQFQIRQLANKAIHACLDIVLGSNQNYSISTICEHAIVRINNIGIYEDFDACPEINRLSREERQLIVNEIRATQEIHLQNADA